MLKKKKKILQQLLGKGRITSYPANITLKRTKKKSKFTFQLNSNPGKGKKKDRQKKRSKRSHLIDQRSRLTGPTPPLATEHDNEKQDHHRKKHEPEPYRNPPLRMPPQVPSPHLRSEINHNPQQSRRKSSKRISI